MLVICEEYSKSKNVYPEYYDAAAAQAQPRPFPSPVNDPKWLAFTVEWFTQGESVLEVGPGRGEFADAVIAKGGPKRYYLVDMSQGMLDLVKKKIDKTSSLECIFIHADIDVDPLQTIPDASLERIIMINAFQDVDPHAVLRVFRRIIASHGLLRINVINREFREENLSGDEDYDRETGYFYLTRCPSENIKPLGFLQRKSGEQVPYYRMLKSYYLPDLKNLLYDSGFEIVSTQPIIIPREIWSKTIAGVRVRPREDILKKFGGYPGSIDVIFRPI